jgi:hypothetical protein
MFIMKKTLLLIAILIPLAFSGCGSEQSAAPVEVTTEVTTEESTTEDANAENKKIVNALTDYYNYCIEFMTNYQDIFETEIDIWDNIADEKSSKKTDKYTKDKNGNFLDDQSDGVNKYYASSEYMTSRTSCETYLGALNSTFKEIEKHRDSEIIEPIFKRISESQSLIKDIAEYIDADKNMLTYPNEIEANYKDLNDDLRDIGDTIDKYSE